MCQVGRVVDEHIAQLNGITATEGAIKAQLAFFVYFLICSKYYD